MKKFKFFSVNNATGQRTELVDTHSVVLELEDGQEFELAAFLSSGQVKIMSSVALSFTPDTMSSMVINDNPTPSLDTSLVRSCRSYQRAAHILDRDYGVDIDELCSEAEYVSRYNNNDPEGVVVHLAAKHNFVKNVMSEIPGMSDVSRQLQGLTIMKN